MQKFISRHKMLVVIILCFLTSFMVSSGISSDVYFMINSAKTMLHSGFYYNDNLTMFKDLPFYTQKWAMCFLTYGIFSLGGMTALTVGLYVLSFIRCTIFVHMVNTINPNSKTYNVFICVFGCLVMNVYSLDFRPSLIADCFLFLEIIVLESYVHNKINASRLYLYLALISFAIMWFHSTMWFVSLLFVLPYLWDIQSWQSYFDNLSLKIHTMFYDNAMLNKEPLKYASILMILVGFLQPNGVKQFRYLFYVILSNSSLSKIVQECKALTFNSTTAIVMFMLIILMIVAISQSDYIELRFVYLVLGTFIMSCISQRCLVYFIPSVFIMIASCARNSKENVLFNIIGASQYGLFVLTISLVLCLPTYVFTLSSVQHAKSANQSLGYAADDYLVERGVPKDAKIYCSFDLGSYLEYLGYKPYIDGRLEVFSYNINQKYDILDEYVKKYDGSIKDLKYMMDKYDFDYYIVTRKSGYVDSLTYLNAKCIYQDPYYYIYSKPTNE